MEKNNFLHIVDRHGLERASKNVVFIIRGSFVDMKKSDIQTFSTIC